jgi:tripartite-type tricarboxylate transporter receptor subunit TctC
MNDAVAGHVDLLFDGTARTTQQVQKGKIRAIVRSGKARSPFLPNVPSVGESGVAGF